MLVSEVGAKALRCCGPESAGELNYKDAPPSRNCSGSRCMAWRWAEPEYRGQQKLEKGHAPPDGDGWTLKTTDQKFDYYVQARPARKGFCGLAGRVDQSYG